MERLREVGLPEASGLRVTRWIKKNRPSTLIILATGRVDMITSDDYEQVRIAAALEDLRRQRNPGARTHELLAERRGNEQAKVGVSIDVPFSSALSRNFSRFVLRRSTQHF